MKILFLGDSITDMCRNRNALTSAEIYSYGSGYPIFVASDLYKKDPNKYEVLNRGISGNRIVDLYARVKADVWNLQPDVLSILIGINDIWHEVSYKNGVDIVRFDKVYRMLIEDTKKALPNVKIVLCEPFVLHGWATDNTEEMPDKFEKFSEIHKYAKVIKKIAEDYNLFFLPLQEKFNEKAKEHGAEHYLYDGVHPMVAGATLIANEWVKLFEEKIDK